MRMLVRLMMRCDACGKTETEVVDLAHALAPRIDREEFCVLAIRNCFHLLSESPSRWSPERCLCECCYKRYKDLFMEV